MKRQLAAIALYLCAGAAVRGQTPPGASLPAGDASLAAAPTPGSPAAVRWQLGQQAMAGGDRAAAVPHLLAALEFHPHSSPILFDLLRAVDDEGAKALWTLRLGAALGDARGKCEFDAAMKKAIPAPLLASAQKLAQARAQAAQELLKAFDRYKPGGKTALGNGVAAAWLCRLLAELCQGAPSLRAAHGPACERALSLHEPDIDAICRALLQTAQGQFGAGTTALADAEAERLRRLGLQLRSARILQGILRQAGYGKDLYGDAPPSLLDGYRQPAAAALAAVKAALPAPRVYTIAELEALDERGRSEFTLRHRDWADPGVALSPGGKYRIETVCGAETLLGTASTIELHHARLVAHFGVDPFEGRQGTVLVVPEVFDMETEGMPFWWAGGFQGGDRTVVRFAWGDIVGLGRLLTHELTHRFDSVLRPFLGAWYGEGHASWTGGHYGPMAAADFHDDHLDLGACWRTAAEGYRGEDKLKRLLRGELEEYRDNYFAGYTLYAFLRGYPPDEPPRYRSALLRLEQTARAGQKDPVGHFEKTICDGKEGRAADFAAFVEQWQGFLDGIVRHLDERTRGPDNAWVARYGPLPAGDKGKMVEDEMTWSWARARHEPFFGQGHAGSAGDVLAEAGQLPAATAAWLWSLSCEGWQQERSQRAADALAALSRPEQAAALRQLSHLRFPLQVAGWPGPAPMFAKLPKTKAYLDLLEATAAALPAGAAAAAMALRGERQRLAILCGVADADLLQGGNEAVEPSPPPRSLLGLGLQDDMHVDYDKGRAVGFWHTTEAGDLHVGRQRPAEGTGGPERDSPQRNVFVRTQEWLSPGKHKLTARIHMTTAFVDGAIVLGHWRRDRGVQVRFSLGDQAFASGRKTTRAETDRVHIGLGGKWERDGKMPQTAPSGVVEFGEPRPSFELELLVDGPRLVVMVEGQERFSYTAHDGAPIEGHVGFASSRGSYRVQAPTITRLDLAEPGQYLAAAAGVGLDLDRPCALPAEELVGLPVRGIAPSPVGRLVLWLPPAEEGDDLARRLPRALPVLAKFMRDEVEFPQPWTLCVPRGTPAEKVQAIQGLLADYRKEPMAVREHAVAAPFRGHPYVLFLDKSGVLRGANQVGDVELFSIVQRWARMFRAR